MAAFFAAALRADLSDAWKHTVPNEPLIKKVLKHNPEEVDFVDRDTPALFVWQADDTVPQDERDDITTTNMAIRLLWVAPPAHNQNQAKRHSFFAAFRRSVVFAVKKTRHKAWVHSADLALGEDDLTRLSAEHYGSSVLNKAGIERWKLRSVTRVPVIVPTGAESKRYIGYLAAIDAVEATNIDPSADGLGLFNISADLISQKLVVDEDTTLEPIERFSIQQS